MKKYRQTVIPEVSTADWACLKPADRARKVLQEYRQRYMGTRVVNLHRGITIEFEAFGCRKTAHSAPQYIRKAALVTVLDQLLRYGEYSNWGNSKEKDPDYVLGYLNFKAKVKIDGKMEYAHLVVRVRNTGKFHYSMEVNKISDKEKPAGGPCVPSALISHLPAVPASKGRMTVKPPSKIVPKNEK